MESTRQKKVSRLIQKELSFIFQKTAKEMIGNILLSVTEVRMSPDLVDANIFLSFYPSKKAVETLKIVNFNCSIIRRKLGEQLRNQLRVVPSLKFHLDNSADYIEEIDRLLKK